MKLKMVNQQRKLMKPKEGFFENTNKIDKFLIMYHDVSKFYFGFLKQMSASLVPQLKYKTFLQFLSFA